MKVAFLTTDSREHFRDYTKESPYFGTAPAALLEGFVLLGTPEIHVVSASQAQLRSPEKLAPNIWYYGLHVPRWGWLRTGYLGCILAVRKKIARIQPDLVHAQGTERDCAIEAVASGYPNLLTLHGNIRSVAKKMKAAPFSYYGLQSFLESWTLKQIGGVLCNSHYTESMVSPLNPRTHLVPNAVRRPFFESPRQETSPHKTGFRLLMVGVIAPYKQPLEFLKFLRHWRQQASCPVTSCLWVGRAESAHPYARQFLREIAEAKSEGWAEHFGELTSEALIREMDRSDLLVHLPTEEAFGLVVVEAMIRGLPIVAGQTGGLPDFAEVYPNLRLVSVYSPSEWRLAIEAESRRRARISLESWPSQKYHPRTIAQKHLEIYQGLINAR